MAGHAVGLEAWVQPRGGPDAADGGLGIQDNEIGMRVELEVSPREGEAVEACGLKGSVYFWGGGGEGGVHAPAPTMTMSNFSTSAILSGFSSGNRGE